MGFRKPEVNMYIKPPKTNEQIAREYLDRILQEGVRYDKSTQAYQDYLEQLLEIMRNAK